MSWKLVCAACAADEEIKCIGILSHNRTCAACGATMPLMHNGFADGYPVQYAQLQSIRRRIGAVCQSCDGTDIKTALRAAGPSKMFCSACCPPIFCEACLSATGGLCREHQDPSYREIPER